MMMKIRRQALLVWILWMLMSVMVCAAGQEPQDAVRITVIGVNDFHGALYADKKNPGAAAWAKAIAAIRAENPAGTILLSAGDMFQGSMEANLLYGANVIDLMNALQFDAMTVGNHEFDWNLDVLKARKDQADFPFLGANVLLANSGERLGLLQPYRMVERCGVKIGVIGIATPETAYKANPKYVAGLRFGDPAAALRRALRELREQGAQVILVLGHLGCEEEDGILRGEAAELAAGAGVDLIISGHSHTVINGAAYGIPIVQAGSHGRYLDVIELSYSRGTQSVVTCRAEVRPVAVAEENPEIEQLLAAGQGQVDRVKQRVLGVLDRPLTHDRDHVSALGNWVTDVLRQVFGTDIALYNGGGLRAELAQGEVTAGALYEVIPFDNTVYIVEMTGEQIMRTLEYGLQTPGLSLLQFSGLVVVRSSHGLVQVTLSDGRALQPDDLYTVATNDFMAAGGDHYMAVRDARQRNTDRLVRDVLGEALCSAAMLPVGADGRYTFSIDALSGQECSQPVGVE